jgi:RNA polymerase sigma-70 factor (ECF subfamily)
VTIQPSQPAVADPTSDSALVARLKAGDPDAYEEMVRTRAGRMLSVARRFLNDDEAARDAVQDAFLSAFRGIQRFDGQAQLSTWLHRIVVNAALMRIRSRQRRPEQSIEPMLPVFAEDGHHIATVVSWTETGEHVLERKETRALVRAAIAELPESYRAVLLLRDIEELSTKEAADLVGISENALKLRLHRARQALATVIKRRLAAPADAPRTADARPPVSAPRLVSAPRRAASSSWDRSAGSARIPGGR